MKKSVFHRGFGFGVSTAIITILAVIVGMHAGADERDTIMASVIIVAFADSLADGIGTIIGETSKGENLKESWAAGLVAFLSKFILALTFLIPFLIFQVHIAIVVSLIYGLTVLGIYSYYLSKRNNANAIKTIFLHIILAIAVIAASHFVGKLIDTYLYDY